MKYECWGYSELVVELNKRDKQLADLKKKQKETQAKLKKIRDDRNYYKELYEYNNEEM